MTHQAPQLSDDEGLPQLLAALSEQGTLTGRQSARLVSLLRGSDEALSAYIRFMAMEADLESRLGGSATAQLPGDRASPNGLADAIDERRDAEAGARGPVANFDETVYGWRIPVAEDDSIAGQAPAVAPPPPPKAVAERRRFAGPHPRGVVAAAAVLLVGLGVWLASRNHAPSEPGAAPAVATLSASVDAGWDDVSPAPAVGSSLRVGESLGLSRGFVQLTYPAGVQVLVQGPSQLTLQSVGRLVLEHGRLTATVPANARGFTVGAPGAEVVDLGTEFGVSAAPDKPVDVQVFVGRVRARRAACPDTQGVAVIAGQAARVDGAGVSVRRADVESVAYVRDMNEARSVAAANAAVGGPERDDIVFADFEGPDYGAWKVEGEAFGMRPASGKLPNQKPVTGYLGHGLVDTYQANGEDTLTGRLTSPDFKVQRRYVTFLIGGGGWPGKTCMNLLVGGKVVRTATGPRTETGGSEALFPASWDVSDFLGQSARIEIVDQATGTWGHINVDQIVFTNRGPASPANTRGR